MTQVLKHCLLWAAVVCLAACGDTGRVAKSELKEGFHYHTYEAHVLAQKGVLPALADADVTEFFAYSCSHCQHFAPILNQWKGGHANKKVTYVPVVWGADTELYAKVFYLVQDHANFEALHLQLFELVAGFSRTDTLDDQKIKLIQWLQTQGMQPIDVVNALQNPGEANNALEQKLAAAVLLAKQYEITGTPTLIAKGRYRIDNQSIKGYEDMLSLLDQLLAQK